MTYIYVICIMTKLLLKKFILRIKRLRGHPSQRQHGDNMLYSHACPCRH